MKVKEKKKKKKKKEKKRNFDMKKRNYTKNIKQ